MKGRLLSYMSHSYTEKGYNFLAVVVISRISIFAILFSNMVFFLHASLKLATFFKRSFSFIIIDKTIKVPL